MIVNLDLLSIVDLVAGASSDKTMAAWVYILRCADGSYYTGCTTNIEQRIGQHHAGTTGGYTFSRRPVEVIYVEEFQRIHDAIDAERRIKRWSRVKKEALIDQAYERLPELSRNRQYHPAPSLRPSTRASRCSG